MTMFALINFATEKYLPEGLLLHSIKMKFPLQSAVKYTLNLQTHKNDLPDALNRLPHHWL
jgi:hypothetical protein